MHASLLEAIQLSRAKHQRYEHLDLNDLDSKIKNFKPDYIVTESIFGMEGMITPLKEISVIAQKNSVALIVDDAHGFGILGAQGKGAVELIPPANITCLINPLGKSFNAMGGLVSGSKAVIELILQFAKTYRYATALPPLIAAGAKASLQVIKEEPWRREKLIELSEFFISEARCRDLALISTDITPIKSLIISDHENLLTIQEALLNSGYKVAAIRPPSVPEHSARLKICLNTRHTKSDIKSLLDLIVKYKK